MACVRGKGALLVIVFELKTVVTSLFICQHWTLNHRMHLTYLGEIVTSKL